MSHFWGQINNHVNQPVSRRGFATQGMDTNIKSWNGELVIRAYQDYEGIDRFRIFQRPHNQTGQGIMEEIATGIFGVSKDIEEIKDE
tara:strand:- start:9585 stop:9845 length:261 start_codon:yes stop_codon:yes gene_type:complete